MATRAMPASPEASARSPLPEGRIPRWLRHGARTLLHLGSDAAAVALAHALAYHLRFRHPWVLEHLPPPGGDPGWELYSRLLYAVVPLWLAIFWYASRLYAKPWGFFDRTLRILKGACLAGLGALAYSYIYNRLEYSRLMLLLACPLSAAAVSLTQWLVLRLDVFLARVEATAPLLVVGGGKVAELIRGYVLARHPGASIEERERLPRPLELSAFAANGFEEVVLARNDLGHAELLEFAEACESAGLVFKMIPDLLELRLGEVQMDDSLGLPAYRLQHTSLTRANFLAKRAFDAAFSLLILAAASPLLLLIALLIALDSRGPVLYRQRRLGLKGRVFEAYKFRTMVADAETALARVKGLNDQSGGFFKAKKDPRVTRVGAWLRRFSLDEMPQFLNVLKGDMSVVGPRPLAVSTGEIEDLARHFGPTARKRMNILPGITGLWQVSGRSDISAEQRFALDMFYIEHWSLGLDVEIILKTVPAMLSGRGAY